MPTTKNISQIGATTINVIKDTSNDSVLFNIDDKDTNGNSSPKTVMEITSSGTSSLAGTTGMVTVPNLTVNGAFHAGNTSVPKLTVNTELEFTDSDPSSTTVIGRIYAKADPTSGDNHQLIIDPINTMMVQGLHLTTVLYTSEVL